MTNVAIKMLFKFVAINPTTLEITLTINAITANPAKIMMMSVSKEKKIKIAFT